MQNVQAVGFRTWDFRASFLTAKWEQWFFHCPTIFDSSCWKSFMTKSVSYYIYHVQASGKMLLLKLFFSSFCTGCLLPLFGKGQEDRGKRSTGNLSLYHFITHNMKINLKNWEHGCHCQILSMWHFVFRCYVYWMVLLLHACHLPLIHFLSRNWRWMFVIQIWQFIKH